MSFKLLLLLVLAGWVAVTVLRRRRRPRTMARLQRVLRVLAMHLGPGSEFESIEDGMILLRVDGRLVRISVVKAIDVVENTAPALLGARLRWLVNNASW
jgi:hypothetical protein